MSEESAYEYVLRWRTKYSEVSGYNYMTPFGPKADMIWDKEPSKVFPKDEVDAAYQRIHYEELMRLEAEAEQLMERAKKERELYNLKYGKDV